MQPAIAEAAAAAPSEAAAAQDSLFAPGRGKPLQAVFKSGLGRSGHARAAVDFVTDLLSPIAQAVPEANDSLAVSQAEIPQPALPQQQKAEALVSEYYATAQAADNALEAAGEVIITVGGRLPICLNIMPGP